MAGVFWGHAVRPDGGSFALIRPLAKHGLAAGWLATAAGGAWAGRRPESRPDARAGLAALPVKLLAAIAPTVFVLGLLVAVAMLVNALVFDRRPTRSRRDRAHRRHCGRHHAAAA